MATAFRTTATLPDRTGRYRTCLVLATRLYGEWSDEMKAEHVGRESLPCRAVDLTDAEYNQLEADNSLRFGYVDQPGDVTSDFESRAWELMV